MKVSEKITETWEKQPLTSKVNLITWTRDDSGLEIKQVYYYLSCADNSLVAFDTDFTR